MFSRNSSRFLVVLFAFQGVAQEGFDPVAQALAEGDLYLSKSKYELALDAYHRRTSSRTTLPRPLFLKIASIEEKAGAFPEALDEAKKAIKAPGDNKAVNIQVLQFRASLLAQMAGRQAVSMLSCSVFVSSHRRIGKLLLSHRDFCPSNPKRHIN